MTPDLARELRERLTDARALCAALGLTMAPRAMARQALVLCPWHNERSPSCSVRLAKDGTIAVRCHACGASGDALTLILKVRAIDFREALHVAAEIANAPALVDAIEHKPERSKRPERLSDETYGAIASALLDACSPLCTVAPDVARYVDDRGVYADADAAGVRGLPSDCRALVSGLLANFERADLELAGVLRPGHDAVNWPAWRLLVPWRDRFGRVRCIQRRRLDDGEPRYRFPPDRAPGTPFGADLLGSALDAMGPDGEVVIVEGAIDCLARRRDARRYDERAAVIGVASASTPCAGLPVDLLEGRRVVLALDDDAAGDRACFALAVALHKSARELIRARPRNGKDWAAAPHEGTT